MKPTSLWAKFFYINNNSKKNKIFRRSIYVVKDINFGEKLQKIKLKF